MSEIGRGGIPQRMVRLGPRTVLGVLAVILAVAAVIAIVWIAGQFITWVLISIFLALAINPAVEWLIRRGVHHRGTATAIVYVLVLAAVVAILFAFIPPLARQVNQFVQAIPGYLHDITSGRGPLGFLETKYHVVERAETAVRRPGAASSLLGGATAVLSITKGLLTAVVAIVSIVFLTLFMLLEGRAWTERLFGLLSPQSAPRWRAVGHDIYRTIGGYVTGNLVISLIAGALTGVVLAIVGVPYAIALGLLVAILDLIPLAGATLAAIIVTLVALSHSTTAAIVIAVFFAIYQQVENHLLQPLVYGRTVQLSPLAVLISVGIGAEVAGVLGALAAIPVAGTIHVLVVDWQRHRSGGQIGHAEEEPDPEPSPEAVAAG